MTARKGSISDLKKLTRHTLLCHNHIPQLTPKRVLTDKNFGVDRNVKNSSLTCFGFRTEKRKNLKKKNQIFSKFRNSLFWYFRFKVHLMVVGIEGFFHTSYAGVVGTIVILSYNYCSTIEM